jgi:cytochrome c oxidase subunit 1
MLGITVLGFMVWAHHMFVSGMNPALGMAFGIATTLIALPSGVKVFNWLATLWGARIQLTSAMLFALGFVALFITGGLSGLWLACTPVDVYMHDTYFVVAHFHFIVFGGSVFGLFAACYHWFPKMFGRMLDERLGRVHFVGTFVLTVGVFLMMHQLGLAGMPRRIADPTVYPSLRHLAPLNVLITWSALLLAGWQVFFLVNLFWSLARGPRAPRNPWKAASLEWEADSPPPHGNFASQPQVERGPYEYDPRADGEDFQPQAARIPAPR